MFEVLRAYGRYLEQPVSKGHLATALMLNNAVLFFIFGG